MAGWLRWAWVGVVAIAACRPAPSAPASPPSAPVVAEPEPEPEPVDPRRPEVLERLEKIGVIGASQSAGFGTGLGFRDTLDVALRVPHSIHDSSVASMFLRPLDLGSLQVSSMRLRRVRVVFAIDFLFWFAHGVKPFEQRRAELQQGMAMLDELDVPVFVGDLPDVRGASRTMISPLQIPAPGDLAVLNEDIEQWAAQRPLVHLVPLAGWMRSIKQEREIPLGEMIVDESTGELLQWDLLHPTERGQALLTLLVLEHLRQAWGGLSDDDVVAEPNAVVDLATPTHDPGPQGELPVVGREP
ncbi:MAG: hypothetical protein AAF799_46015 [Myxococcota bacterium]